MAEKQYTGGKWIIIKSRKTITQLGSLTGPVLKPFYCQMGMVSSLVNSGHEVYEVINGKEYRLTPRNYMENRVDAMEKAGVEAKAPDVVVTQVNQNKVAHISGDFDKFTGGRATAELLDPPKQTKRAEVKKNDDKVNVVDVKAPVTEEPKQEAPAKETKVEETPVTPAEEKTEADSDEIKNDETPVTEKTEGETENTDEEGGDAPATEGGETVDNDSGYKPGGKKKKNS